MNRIFNVLKDKFDGRDLPFAGSRYDANRTLAKKVDLREWFPLIADQGNEGACTMFAGAAILSWHHKRFKSQDLVFSPQFGYRAERVIEGTTAEDAGAQSRTMMKVLVQYGLPLESSFPYSDTEWTKKTPFSLLAEARKYRLGAYHSIPSLDILKSCLDSGYIASLAIEVYESMMTDHVMATGAVPMPGPKEKLLGAHEVVACGYDDSQSTVLVRNSWGDNWGMKGYFTLPYAFFPKHMMDSWTCHFGKPWK